MKAIYFIIKLKFRDLEGLHQKFIKKKWAIAFNEACINENIMPKYTKAIYVNYCMYKVFLLSICKVSLKIIFVFFATILNVYVFLLFFLYLYSLIRL